MKNLYYTSNYTEFLLLDVYLEEILGIKTDGFFLEIGAYDGQTNSKTARLADIGWRGIYVEPVKEYAEKCGIRHKGNNVEVLNLAIGAKDGNQTMHKGGLPSTLVETNKNYLEDYMNQKGSSFNFEVEEVNVMSWASFHQKLKGKIPHLLVLDAEGYDLTILKSIDLDGFRPKVICCEVFPETTEFMHPGVIKEGEELIKHLQTNGYELWLVEEHNVLFVDSLQLPLESKDLTRKSSTSLFEKLFKKAFSELSDNKLEKRELELMRFLGDTVLFRKEKALIEKYLTLISNFREVILSPILIKRFIKGLIILDDYERLNRFIVDCRNESPENDWLVSLFEYTEFLRLMKLNEYGNACDKLHFLRKCYPYNLTYVGQVELLKKASFRNLA